jgi:hypothetical protein
MEELQEAVDQGIISQLQFEIFVERSKYRKYDEICRDIRLSSHLSLEHILIRTALGRKWERGQKGGNFTYLSDLDAEKFKTVIIHCSRSLNCLTRRTAINLAYQLAKNRVKAGRSLLHEIRCPTLAESLQEPDPPCKSWVTGFVSALGFHVCRPEMLDSIRRRMRDDGSISYFFYTFAELFNRHPV